MRDIVALHLVTEIIVFQGVHVSRVPYPEQAILILLVGVTLRHVQGEIVLMVEFVKLPVMDSIGPVLVVLRRLRLHQVVRILIRRIIQFLVHLSERLRQLEVPEHVLCRRVKVVTSFQGGRVSHVLLWVHLLTGQVAVGVLLKLLKQLQTVMYLLVQRLLLLQLGLKEMM